MGKYRYVKLFFQIMSQLYSLLDQWFIGIGDDWIYYIYLQNDFVLLLY